MLVHEGSRPGADDPQEGHPQSRHPLKFVQKVPMLPYWRVFFNAAGVIVRGLLGSIGIARRLRTVVTVLSLALAALAGFSYVKLHAVADAAHQTENSRVPQLAEADRMELNITRCLTATAPRHPCTHADRARGIARRHRGQAQADQGVLGHLPERALHRTGQGHVRQTAAEANLALIETDKRDEAFAYLVDKMIPARNEVLTVLDEMVKYQRSELADDVEQIATQISNTLTKLVTLVVVSIIGLVLSSGYVARTLRRRVALSQIVAERARDGDLTTPFHDDARDEFSPLLSALRDMQASLSKIVAGVRGNAESVATASAQIAQGNQDLSSRTEQQASALQETAATMEQLGTTVRHTADNAHQANELALNASGVAVKGGQTRHEIVAAIQRVNAIVGEISSASQEQSSGVGQVGQAIRQMDQATQQNDALVEQSAAAAESLKRQAAQLVQAVAVFKVGHGAGGHFGHSAGLAMA